MTLDDLLRLAYSAERAAAYAYQGHAASLRDAGEQARIRSIEEEEWDHRAHLARMHARRGLVPARYLECKYACIGRTISLSCHVIGHFMPMDFAGRLESGDVNEYLAMADLVLGTDLADERDCILAMARVEKEHERYFLSRIAVHRWLAFFPRVFAWGPQRSFNALPWDEDGKGEPVAAEGATRKV